MRRNINGFTIVEALVAVVIVGIILASILGSWSSGSRIDEKVIKHRESCNACLKAQAYLSDGMRQLHNSQGFFWTNKGVRDTCDKGMNAIHCRPIGLAFLE